MPYTLSDRLRHAWNAFRDRDPTDFAQIGAGYGTRPDRTRFMLGNDRSIVAPIYTRIAIDAASIPLSHVRLDGEGRLIENINSGLNKCLTLEANIDQTGRAFMQDIVMSLCDEGCIAVVPVETTYSPIDSNIYDILSLRTGKIVSWYPKHVRVSLYNDSTGLKEEITLPKTSVAIVENPLYSVMNEPNSTLKRLIQKLNLLDAIDNQSGSGKLDLIMQLPYVIRTQARAEQANIRIKNIQDQLQNSKYGIAYIDGTEKVTQLNRPAENNLMGQIEYLTNMLYSQLGLTAEVFNGTASEDVMLNYYNRTIEPMLGAIADSMKRTFLTKTARSQGQSVKYYYDPFKLVTSKTLADITDTFTRNAVLSSNEIRDIVGRKPSKSPGSDDLSNKNLNQAKPTGSVPGENQNGRSLDDEKV